MVNWTLMVNFGEIEIRQKFSYKMINLKISAKCTPCCLILNMLFHRISPGLQSKLAWCDEISYCLLKLYMFTKDQTSETDTWLYAFNSVWPGDAIWSHRPGSTLPQVMACCLTAPSHHLNQCYYLINKALWHPPESSFTASKQASFYIMSSKIILLQDPRWTPTDPRPP